ncbi:hypothetical protein CJ030_MR6G011347 [Morella rubra]|uniref:Uncharacterized protein n=1 Tax=Morella rubra TaxID=262757 RepID=A0A6A1VE28_9ROSI|nr:hypothetical protein CJ030_MR6G011347 [Morella rubra]
MTRKRFRTISSSSQPPVPPSQEATASQEATPSQPPAHPSEQATMPSFDYDQSLNDNEIIGRHRSHAGKQNRSLQTTVHTAGSKSFARYAHELRRMEEIGLNDSGSSQTSNEFRVDGSIGWSPSDRYAQVIGPERHGRIRGVGLGPTPSSHPANTNEQRQYQDVPNNNQVSPAIHRSSHASRKTSVADNADDAESEEQMVLKVERIKFRVICT